MGQVSDTVTQVATQQSFGTAVMYLTVMYCCIAVQDRWYREKLGVPASGRRQVVEAYIQGLHWVLEYYYRWVCVRGEGGGMSALAHVVCATSERAPLGKALGLHLLRTQHYSSLCGACHWSN
jgi:hypothetical protein